ncbi:MAG: single-stranded DNA-binding protein [Saprospiraceae bacterium]
MQVRNSVNLIGFIGRPVELKYSKNNQAYVRISLGTNRVWTDSRGARQERTDWHNCVAFGKRAETLAKYTEKGMELAVMGNISYGEYTDDQQIKRYSTSIQIEEFTFLGSKKKSTNQQINTPSMVSEPETADAGEAALPF